MSTTQRIKSQFPDLNFVKPLPVDKHPRYTEYGITFNPNQHLILSKGHVMEEGRKKMLVDCVVNRDTPIPLRDGLHVYADVYRPATSDDVKVPVVICWSPYGKSSISLDKIWHRSGVPRDWTSGYETFEGLDPAEWCKRGYAIVNVDARGTQFSEGTFFSGETKKLRIYMTRLSFCLDSRGATDLFAWEEARTWQKPKLTSPRQSHPALKALAPYEGFTDIYRQLFRRGGFSMNNIFAKWYQWGVSGNYEVEDMAKMVKTHSLFDDYWAGKLDQVTNIDDIPLYLLGSFSNPFHVYGSFDTFRHASSTRKWMRVHSTFEWYELYERKSNDDLHRFFDRYCKGIKNGWEQDTPLLRLSLHGFGSIPNIVERTETEFPLRRQRLEKYYLEAATKTIHATARDSKSSVSHDGHGLDASSVGLQTLCLMRRLYLCSPS